MSLPAKPSETSVLVAARWPLIVVGLLVGHMLLMMIAVVWSRAIPAAVTPVENPTSDTSQNPPSPTRSP